LIDLNDTSAPSAVPSPQPLGVIDLNDAAPQLALSVARYDLDELSRRLAAQAESWVPQLFPNGRKEAGEFRLANIRGDAPRKNGSCVIPLSGHYAGCFHDFSTGESGGPLKTLEHATGLSGRPLFDYAAGLVGMATPATPAKPRRTSRKARDEEIGREIAFLLSQSQPLAHTLGATYLASRGLPVPATPDLQFHPSATYHDTATGYPALIAVVRDAAGQQLGLHRTYLKSDGSGKAEVPKPRMMLGPVAGGVVSLLPLGASLVLLIAEGLETALSALLAFAEVPVWAALSAGNLERLDPPAQVTRIIILADHDASGTGLKAALRAAARHHAAGRRVWIALPPNPGDDFNDLLRREGLEAVRTVIANAREWLPEAGSATVSAQPAALSPAPKIGRRKPLGFHPDTGKPPVLRADNGDLADVTDRCWTVLQDANDPPWLFRCAAQPAWIERDDKGHPVPKNLTENRLRHVLAQLITWTCRSKSGDMVPAYPPVGVVANLLATPDPDLPVLSGIVTAPVFGASGELLTTPGYHPATELLYHPPAGFNLPPVPERPSAAEIAAARTLLLDDMLGEFPFVGEAERAHALALLLLPFLRPMIGGPTPLHLIEKPAPGTGAGLMVEAVGLVVTGTSVKVMVEGRDDEEWRKRLTAKLREIPTLLLIDNLRRTLDSSAVAAALTAPVWDDRILGKSENVHFPIRCTWIATGNNPQFSNEMARRLIRIRLDSQVDNPWLRHGFRHDNLLEWVRENRGRLVTACLTLGQAWIAAGMPRHKRTVGSFEEWAQVIGGVLDVAGVPGFLGNLAETYHANNAEGSAQRVFIATWWERYGQQPVAVAELYNLAIACDPALPMGDGSERSQRTRLGLIVGRLRDRVFRLGETVVLLKALGTQRQAPQWALLPQQTKSRRPDGTAGERVNVGEPFPGSVSAGNGIAGERGERCEPFPGSDAGVNGMAGEPGNLAPVNVGVNVEQRSHQRSPGNSISDQWPGERCEPCEPFPAPYAYASTHTHAPAHTPTPTPTREDPGKRSPGSQGSLTSGNTDDISDEPLDRTFTRFPDTAQGKWRTTI